MEQDGHVVGIVSSVKAGNVDETAPQTISKIASVQGGSSIVAKPFGNTISIGSLNPCYVGGGGKWNINEAGHGKNK